MSDEGGRVVWGPGVPQQVEQLLHQDADAACRAGDRAVRSASWLVANEAYRLACRYQTAARRVRLNLGQNPADRPLIESAYARTVKHEKEET